MSFPAETEGLYESLPESVVASVLDRWGYKDSETGSVTEPEPAIPEPIEPEPEPEPIAPESEPESPGGEPPAGEPEPVPEPAQPAPEPEPEIPEIPAPGGPVWQPETPPAPPTPGVVGPSPEPAGLTAQQIAAYQQLEQRVNADPAFRAGLQALLSPVTPPPASYYPPLPQLSPDDIQDPATQALVMIAHRQQQELAELRSSLSQQAQLAQQSQRQEALEVSNAVRSSFKQQYNLPDQIMDEIDKQIVPQDISYYMTNVKADPYGAAEFALTRAYWNSQPARSFEFERQADNRAKALERKQRLAGVGGSSGSSPRTTPAPDVSTPEARKQAAIAEVATAMFGDQQ